MVLITENSSLTIYLMVSTLNQSVITLIEIKKASLCWNKFKDDASDFILYI